MLALKSSMKINGNRQEMTAFYSENKEMRKVISYILVTVLALALFVCSDPINVQAATKKVKTREIHIVYDDSGSMIDRNASWSQAKYALEVFAAMMGENDKITIYPMSAFSYKDGSGEKSDNWGKTIELTGSKSLEDRIKTVRNMNGDNGEYRNTPIQTVQKAGNDLRNSDKDEKWLLILTDGAFDNGHSDADPSSTSAKRMDTGNKKVVEKARDYVKETVLGFSGLDNIRVFFVGFKGDDLDPLSRAGLSDTPATDSFYKESADKKAILKTITKAARTIYNLTSIPVKGTGNVELNPDIPVSKFVIFAQGKDVSVGNILYQDNALAAQIDQTEVEVSPETDEHPKTETRHNSDYADNLKGRIITYTSEDANKPFSVGKYSFSCAADTVEVYFEPGVDIQVLLTNNNTGEQFNLSEGVDYLEEGTYQVGIQMVNPLTGEKLEVSDSNLLEGCQLGALITASEETSYYPDGSNVTIQRGDILIQGRAVFRDDSEKNSGISTVHVGAGELTVEFRESAYNIDPLHLSSADIEIQVSDKDHVLLSSDEYSRLEINANGLQGIEFSAEPAGQDGWFRLHPRCSESGGTASINTADQRLAVSASLDDQGHVRTGTGSAVISFDTQISAAEIILEMEMPEPSIISEKGTRYMLDAAQSGKIESNIPYILINAQVLEEDGSTRNFTEEEWNAGLNAFHFSSESKDATFIWRFIEFFCRQNLDFAVVKDEEISKYRLYLSNLNPVTVRPNMSELSVDLEIRLSNGILEKGGTKGVVSVRPLGDGILPYLGFLIAILILLAVILLILYLEYQKPRLPRDLYIKIECSARKINGKTSAVAEGLPDVYKKVKVSNRIFPITAPETGHATISYSNVLKDKIKVHLVAEKRQNRNRRFFRFKNIKSAWPRRNGPLGEITVLIGDKKPNEHDGGNFSTSSLIVIDLTGNTEAHINVKFTRMKKKEAKKINKKRNQRERNKKR